MITFDCASPFLATANGQIYCELETEDRRKWVYRMVPSVDDKSLYNDITPFSQAFVREGKHPSFFDSPITAGLNINDICKYGPGDLNKQGKEGKTSWDSFSYALMMGHNVWMHINAVQEANRIYDQGIYPSMLINDKFIGITLEFKEVVNDIFSTDNKDTANQINDDYQKYLDSIKGTRGTTGKKMTNASSKYKELFEEV